MEDEATVIELNMSTVELEQIVEKWAAEEKFSKHEKSLKRTLYFKNIRFNTAWLSIESDGENSKIITWLAPKGMKPDAKGNFWLGRKIAVPNGFTYGPPRIYRKQFNKLISTLEGKPEIIVKRALQNDIQRANKTKGTFAAVLAAIGIIQFIGGVFSILSANIFIANYPSLGTLSMKNGIFNAVTGALTYVCSRMLKKGKASAIWFYVAVILLTVVYNNMMGYEFPYFTIFFGAFVAWQLWILQKQSELS